MDTSAFVVLRGRRIAAEKRKQQLSGTISLSQEQLDMINQAIKNGKEVKVTITIED